MASKGVDYYFYSDADDIRTEITAPKISRTHGREANFLRNNLQVQSKNLPWNVWTGDLEWITRRGSAVVARQLQKINTFDGKLGGGTMRNMFATPPQIGNPTVCWGFYDAGGGGGVSKLTNQNQLYAYATRDQRRWMSELAARNPRVARVPFSRFALPGAHDAGMFDMTAVMKILNNPVLVGALLASLRFIPFVGPVVLAAGGIGRAFAPRAIANLAMTQKDNVRTMLDVGTRYFDFRPGTMHSSLKAFTPRVRYHQHGVIPGYPYVAFLEDVLRWLNANPGEIVVVSANTQGFSEGGMKPSAADLGADLRAALANVRPSPSIDVGDKRHLGRSYEELIHSNTRLLFLNQIEGETRKYDSWNSTYATLTPGPVIRAFEAMQPDVPGGEDYVVLQMQAMSPALGAGVVVPSIFTTSDASSPLLATKAVMDAATNPWLRNSARVLSPNHLLVLLNDFVDNCMVETAAMVTEQRVARESDLVPIYQAHVAYQGWLPEVQNGVMAGTTGQGHRCEAIKVRLRNGGHGMKIRYRTHIQDVGWSDWSADGQQSGTTGLSKQIEAIEIKLDGAPDNLGVFYQAYATNGNWLEWQKDGGTAGTTGQGRKLEAFRVFLAHRQ